MTLTTATVVKVDQSTGGFWAFVKAPDGEWLWLNQSYYCWVVMPSFGFHHVGKLGLFEAPEFECGQRILYDSKDVKTPQGRGMRRKIVRWTLESTMNVARDARVKLHRCGYRNGEVVEYVESSWPTCELNPLFPLGNSWLEQVSLFGERARVVLTSSSFGEYYLTHRTT